MGGGGRGGGALLSIQLLIDSTGCAFGFKELSQNWEVQSGNYEGQLGKFLLKVMITLWKLCNQSKCKRHSVMLQGLVWGRYNVAQTIHIF